jgi:CRP/FNR family transcriptional regulator, cyclic AMP receptor protein
MPAKPGGLLVAEGLAEIASASARDLPRVSLPALRQVPLFAGLSDRHLRKVAKLVMPVRFDAGAAIVREGSPGHTFFVILEGRATVVRRSARPAKLRPGEYFGEMALLDRRPRSATVMAETELSALRISADPFAKLLRSEPSIAIALLETLSVRVRELERQSV